MTDPLGNREDTDLYVHGMELRASMFTGLSELGPLRFSLDLSLHFNLYGTLNEGILANLRRDTRR